MSEEKDKKLNIRSAIESLLFISAKPMSVKQLAEIMKSDESAIENAGNELVAYYKEAQKGVQIIKSGSKFQMVSSPENAKLIQEFLQDETSGDLSRPSLETLTIIAYRGPISKFDIDRIRGVNCSLILRNLMLRGLIEQKSDKKKNENYYTVSFDFIRFLGINDIKELPDFERLSADDTIDRMLEGQSESTGENGKDDPTGSSLRSEKNEEASEDQSEKESDDSFDDENDVSGLKSVQIEDKEKKESAGEEDEYEEDEYEDEDEDIDEEAEDEDE